MSCRSILEWGRNFFSTQTNSPTQAQLLTQVHTHGLTLIHPFTGMSCPQAYHEHIHQYLCRIHNKKTLSPLVEFSTGTPLGWGFPGGSVCKESTFNEGKPGSIPGSGRSPGEGNSNPLQHSCLENSMDRGAWQATAHGVVRVGLDLVTKPPPLQAASRHGPLELTPALLCWTERSSLWPLPYTPRA